MDKFRRNLLALLGETPSANYIKCDYIENPSTAYINTGIKPTQNLKMEIVFLSTVFKPWAVFFGSRTTDETIGYFLGYHSVDNVLSYHFGKGTHTSVEKNIVNVKTTVKVENKKMIINGLVCDAPTLDYTSPLELYLFGLNLGTPLGKSYDGGNENLRIFSCKLYNGDILVRDFVPVFESSSNTYGMLDNIENKFYTSPNNIEFIGKKL